MFVIIFFFQAEDGIRDLVRSRGLGDVYKRQFFERSFVKKNLNDLEGYKADLNISYKKGYLHAYHFLKEA